jgi:hypothetical protein
VIGERPPKLGARASTARSASSSCARGGKSKHGEQQEAFVVHIHPDSALESPADVLKRAHPLVRAAEPPMRLCW